MFATTRARLLLFGAAIIVLALAATLLLWLPPAARNPATRIDAALAAAERYACPANYQLVPGSYHVIVQEDYPAASVVVHAAECGQAGQPAIAAMGFQVVERSGPSGQTGCGGGGSATGGAPQPGTAYCPFSMGPGGASLAWGPAPAGARAINVVFAGGQIVPAGLAGGFYAAALPELAEACQVVVIDQNAGQMAVPLRVPGGGVPPLPVGVPACP
jgi:hypothetical protein